MGLLDECLASNRRRGPKCTVQLVLEELDHHDPELAAEFREALTHPRPTNRSISERMDARGYEVATYSIMRHRRGDCKCPRETS